MIGIRREEEEEEERSILIVKGGKNSSGGRRRNSFRDPQTYIDDYSFPNKVEFISDIKTIRMYLMCFVIFIYFCV